MRLIVTTTDSLNKTNDEMNAIKNDDIVCIFYENIEEGLNVNTVDKLMKNGSARYFIKVNEDKAVSIMFQIGKIIGKENPQEIVVCAEDEVMKAISGYLKTENVSCSTMMKKARGGRPKVTNNETKDTKVEKIPAKRGRKPKQKTETDENKELISA